MPKTESACLQTWMSGWRAQLLLFVKRRSPTKLLWRRANCPFLIKTPRIAFWRLRLKCWT